MSTSAMEKISSAGVQAPLTYTLNRPEKLIYKITEMGEDEDSPEYHAWYSVHDMTIHDARSAGLNPSLDVEGFVLVRATTAVTDFYDETEVEQTYNREVEKMIAELTGAQRVLVFDHTVRIASDDLRRARKVREVVDLVHNDYTIDSGPQRVRDLIGDDEAEDLLSRRFAVYNVWRSIAGTVEMTPLAVCDAHSVAPDDWVACGLDYGDRMGEIYNVAHSPAHRWFYYPRMSANEVLVFKNFDSADDGRARFTPHTAFVDPTAPADARPRESIETRVLAFF